MEFDEYENDFEKSWLIAWVIIGPIIYGVFALTLWIMGGNQ
jgi:hypothetical protein